MSKGSSNLLAEIRQSHSVLGAETESALASLVAVAEDSRARPSSRVKARQAIKMMHQKIMAHPPAPQIYEEVDQTDE